MLYADGWSDRDRFGLVSRWQVVTSFVLVCGALGLSGPVVARPFAYSWGGPPVPEIATDLLVVAICVPLLVGGLWVASRDSVRGYVLWLGALGFLTYRFGGIVLSGPTSGPTQGTFAVVLALFSVALFATVGGVLAFPIDGFGATLDRPLPTRLVAGGLVAAGLLLALVWVLQALTSPFRGAGQVVLHRFYDTNTGNTAAVVWELGVLAPAAVVTARLLARASEWGHALASVLGVVLASVALSNLTFQLLLLRGGYAYKPGRAALYALVAVLALALVATYLHHLGGPRGDAG